MKEQSALLDSLFQNNFIKSAKNVFHVTLGMTN